MSTRASLGGPVETREGPTTATDDDDDALLGTLWNRLSTLKVGTAQRNRRRVG